MKSASEVSLRPICRDSAGIQTRNLLIRSQMLYSVKLRNRTLSQTNKEKLRFSLILLNWRQKGTSSFLTLIQKNQVSASLLCRGVVRKTKSTNPRFLKSGAKIHFNFYNRTLLDLFFTRNNVFISAEPHPKPQMPDLHCQTPQAAAQTYCRLCILQHWLGRSPVSVCCLFRIQSCAGV